MSVIVRELAKSRARKLSFDGADLSLDFIAMGSNDDAAIYAAVYLVSPATYAVAGAGGRTYRLRRKEISLDSVGAGVWTAEATYGIQLSTADTGSDDPQDTDDATPAGPELSFDTTGGTEHVTQSLATISSVGPVSGPAAPNYSQAINVTRDSVGGVDRVAPKFEFTLTVPKVGLSRSYVRDLARNTGKTNSATWNGYAAGEVLFLGATGSAKPADGFVITYKFAVQENRTNVIIRPADDGISGHAGEIKVDKKGWEYVWCAYKDTTSNNLLVQIPVAAYVEQIYRSFNFTTVLGF